jgi:methylmalonyl-CoA mutase cobalamin-binding subunit
MLRSIARVLLVAFVFVLAIPSILPAAPDAAAGPAAAAQWQKTPEGEMILRPFANAPYPHKSRENGFKGSKTTYGPEHYADSTVGIVIPAGYRPGDTVDFVVHFHGHMNHVSNVLTKYKLPQQLVAAKVNAILLVPQGPTDAADSGGGKLELDPGGFAKLIDEVAAYLKAEGKIKTTTVGKIVLAAHSGGYKVTAAVLHHGGMAEHITDVLLLDASYGSLEWFADWCKAPPDHRLVSLFTDHLADENQALMKLLDQAGVKHRQLDEQKLADEQFAARGPVFMHTKGPHDQVPVDYFGRLVQTSTLSPIE